MTYSLDYYNRPILNLSSGPPESIVDSPERLAMWSACYNGDTLAKNALMDWYEDHGVIRDRSLDDGENNEPDNVG